MTLTIELAPEDEDVLRERAAAVQQDVSTFARQALMDSLRRPSLSDLLAPIHDAVRDAGVTEAEADAMIDRGIREVREERRRGGRP